MKKGHYFKDCTVKNPCRVAGCPGGHHTLCHDPNFKVYLGTELAFFVENTDESVGHEFTFNCGRRVAFKCDEFVQLGPKPKLVTKKAMKKASPEFKSTVVRIVAIRLNGTVINALLDDGSTCCLIDKDLANQLKVRFRKGTARITGVSGKPISVAITENLCIEALEGGYKWKVSAKVVDGLCVGISAIDWNSWKLDYDHLKDIHFPSFHDGPVQMIIGQDLACLLASQQEIEPLSGQGPTARLTRLGWTAAGPVTHNQTNSYDRDAVLALAADFGAKQSKKTAPEEDPEEMPEWASADQTSQQLLEIVREAALRDTLPGDSFVKKSLSEPDKRAAELMKKVRRLEDGHYEVPCLISSDERPLPLPNNYHYALNRMKKLQCSKHFKNEFVRSEFHKAVEKWQALGFTETVTDPETHGGAGIWYNPLFPVTRIDKSTTKVRPVVDCAAVFQGVCLNTFMLEGPCLMNDLTQVLTRFRANPVALGGDVEQMFLQLRLRDDEKDLHRFVWINEKGETEIRRFTVHCFGNKGSPFCAMFILRLAAQQLAKEMSKDFSLGEQAVLRSSIVDDILASVNTVDEAITLIDQLKKITGFAGMRIRKFISSHPSALKHLEDSEKAVDLDIADLHDDLIGQGTPVTKTLGVLWSTRQDAFSYVVPPPPRLKRWTKRLVAQYNAMIFDPLGLLAPTMTIAKDLLSQIWKTGGEWDDPLPDELARKYEKWLEELPLITNLRIPRALRLSGSSSPKLFVFADASAIAVASVAYLVTSNPDNTLTSRIISAKSRIAKNLTARTIPRLEMQALDLAAKLTLLITEPLSISKDQVYLFSDSTDVLWWTKESDDKSLLMYIQNRVDRVRAVAHKDNILYVPTKQNPADCASRGIPASELVEHPLWLAGPEFLVNPSKFPEQPKLARTPSTESEHKRLPHITKDGRVLSNFTLISLETTKDGYVEPTGDLTGHPSTFNTWGKFELFVRCAMVWLHNAKRPLSKKLSVFSWAAFQLARRQIWKSVQQESFPRTIMELKHLKLVHRDNKLAGLWPEFDQYGVIRSASRLRENRSLPFDMRCPVILHKDHPAVRLFAEYVHAEVLQHSGEKALSNELQQRLHIPYVRSLARKIRSECLTCRRQYATRKPQERAPLPSYRVPDFVRNHAVFESIAADMFGPMKVKVGGKTQKSYGLVLTCTRYRAVHLELMLSASEDSLALAFSRFFARRGRPRLIRTDQGSNFVGLRNTLKELEKKLDDTHIRDDPIRWDLNTAHAPWTGGVAEIMVRAAKRVLYAMSDEKPMEFETLSTLLADVEATLNSRPITYVSGSDGNVLALSPNHFISGSLFQRLAEIPPDKNLLVEWVKLQKALDENWKRLLAEVIPELRIDHAVTKAREDLKIGDKIMLLEKRVKGKWPLGTITGIFPSQDSLVRSYTIRMNGATRDISRPSFYLLPLIDPATAGTKAAQPYLERLALRTRIPEENYDEQSDEETEEDLMTFPEVEAPEAKGEHLAATPDPKGEHSEVEADAKGERPEAVSDAKGERPAAHDEEELDILAPLPREDSTEMSARKLSLRRYAHLRD